MKTTEISKVESMANNQFIIRGKDFTAFQSYNSIIAIMKMFIIN